MARTPAKTPPARRGPSPVVALALQGLCLSVLALRVTYTEAPTVQTLSLPSGLIDVIYSLTVSGLLIFALVFWLLRRIWSGRPIYRVTGIEIGLGLFLLAAVVSTFAASECPTYTGTRTQVAVARRSGAWRILRLSWTSFHSSDV